jgi:drug/metabolite transporter (DMT)-like permease
LSEVTALGFTAPIFTTLLAALVLGEIVGARRWAAVIVGFVGALIILRPGFAEVGPGQMLVVFSSLVWACALLVIKTLCRTESSATIIAYMALLMIPLTLAPAAAPGVGRMARSCSGWSWLGCSAAAVSCA